MKKIALFLIFGALLGVALCPPLDKDHIRLRVTSFYERMLYEKELDLFSEHLGWKESRNNWKVINSINCMGQFQFHPMTLKRLGYEHITPSAFRQDANIFPQELQKECLKLLIEINTRDLKRYQKYFDTTIKGIHITKAGLLAGMHLGGLGSVKAFLLSNGAVDKQDAYGTKISDYIKEFSVYKL